MVSVIPVLLKVTDDKGVENLLQTFNGEISDFSFRMHSGVSAVSRHVYDLLIAAMYTCS